MPSLSDALALAPVVHALTGAWNRTQEQKVEHGGWIYHNGGIGTALQYSVKCTTSNQKTSIILTKSDDLEWFASRGFTILADFHCHPGGTGDVAGGRPSDADIKGAKLLSYGRLVFTSDTNHYYTDIKATPAPTPTGFPADTILWYVR